MTQKHVSTENVTIGRISYLADVEVDTVRFYERSGLLEARRRTKSGYRLYSMSTIARIQFIRRARVIGLSVEQIRTILEFHDEGGAADEVRDFAESMSFEIDEQVRGLSMWKLTLGKLIEHCDTVSDHGIEPTVLQKLMLNQCTKARH